MKVLIINKTGCSFTVNLDKNTRIYPHFKLYELANNEGDTNTHQMILSPEIDDFMALIEDFRRWWNKPMNCNSCYRQPEYNKSVGGDWNSLHLKALAFDWGVQLTYAQRVAIYQQWYYITTRAGKVGGINFYPWGCHLDASENLFGHKSFVIRDHKRIVPSVPHP